MTVETASKSTWNPYGTLIKKTDIKKLYDLLHKASTSVEREEIMRNAIRFSPEYEKTVFKNLIRNINDAFTTDRDCYKQFKDILYSFLDSMDDSGNPVQFKIKIKTGSRSRSRSKSKSKTPTKALAASPAAAAADSETNSMCALPTPLQPSSQNSVSNLSDLKIGIFVTAFLTCAISKRDQFVKQYIHATRPNGDSSPEFVDVISSDMNTIIRYGQHLSESELISKIITHLKDTKVENENMDEDTIDDIFILYPFPQIHMNMTRKGRRPSIRNLGGGRGKRMRGKGHKTRRFK